jgi:cytochrome c
MNHLSNRQILHRQYLQSPWWKQKRLEALEAYGSICNRCGEYGCDVHHKTYKRIGAERLSDLEVLCRECHQAHHSIERSLSRRARRSKSFHVKAMFSALTESQKNILQEMTDDDLYVAIVFTKSKKCDIIRNRAANMLGGEQWYGLPKKQRSLHVSKHQCPKSYRPSINY